MKFHETKADQKSKGICKTGFPKKGSLKMENLPLHNLFTNEFHLNFLETPYQDALDAVKDQKNELKKNEARLLAKEQELMEMENDFTKQSQEIPFFVNIINYLFFVRRS